MCVHFPKWESVLIGSSLQNISYGKFGIYLWAGKYSRKVFLRLYESAHVWPVLLATNRFVLKEGGFVDPQPSLPGSVRRPSRPWWEFELPEFPATRPNSKESPSGGVEEKPEVPKKAPSEDFCVTR